MNTTENCVDCLMSKTSNETSKKCVFSAPNNMDQYKEFCWLRDHRRPGAEVPQYTEAEAFALATNKCQACSPVIKKAPFNE